MTGIDKDDPVEAARGGDREAVEQVLRTNQAAVHAVCRRITGDDADALDAMQEALIAIVRGLPNFDGRSRLSTWIHRIAVNAAIDEIRRRDRRPLVGLPGHDDGSQIEQPAGGAAVDTVVTDRLIVDMALAGLPIDFRVAVVLRDLCVLDYREIAEILDLPIGTVRSRIARGRRRLAEELSGNRTDPDDRPNL